MHPLLITFVAIVLIGALLDRRYRNRKESAIELAIRSELRAIGFAVVTLFACFVLLYALSLAVGPIPQVHEW